MVQWLAQILYTDQTWVQFPLGLFTPLKKVYPNIHPLALIVQRLAPKTLNLLSWVQIPVRAFFYGAPMVFRNHQDFQPLHTSFLLYSYFIFFHIVIFQINPLKKVVPYSYYFSKIVFENIRNTHSHLLALWQPGRVVKAVDQKSTDKLSRRFESCGCRYTFSTFKKGGTKPDFFWIHLLEKVYF